MGAYRAPEVMMITQSSDKCPAKLGELLFWAFEYLVDMIVVSEASPRVQQKLLFDVYFESVGNEHRGPLEDRSEYYECIVRHFEPTKQMAIVMGMMCTRHNELTFRETALERLTDQWLLVRCLVFLVIGPNQHTTRYMAREEDAAKRRYPPDPLASYLLPQIVKKLSADTLRQEWDLPADATLEDIEARVRTWEYLVRYYLAPGIDELDCGARTFREEVDACSVGDELFHRAFKERAADTRAYIVQMIRDGRTELNYSYALWDIEDPAVLQELCTYASGNEALLALINKRLTALADQT